jgi:ADP-ribosylglycohydrolase
MLTAQALDGPSVDVQKMATRWVEWLAADGRGASSSLRSALDLIRTTGAPPESGLTAGVEPVLRAIPIALKVHASPANLVSGPLHLGALTHPDPRAGWAAVAVAITLAHLVAGERDFVGDVLEALRVNGAPEEVITVTRKIPLRLRSEWGATAALPPALAVMDASLWCAYHEPQLERGATALASLDVPSDLRAAMTAAAVAAMAARDGSDTIPSRWSRAIPGAAATTALGANLVRRDSLS